MESLKLQWKVMLEESRNQWRENTRLQFGSLAIALIFLLWLNLVAADIVDEFATREQGAAETILEQQTEVKGQDWVKRLEQVKSSLGQIKPHFGYAKTEALARADIQSRMAATLEKYMVGQSSVEVSSVPKVDDVTGLLPFQLRVSGQAKGDALLQMLNDLETEDVLVRIEHLTVSNQLNQYLTFTFIATVWYQPFGRGS